jgi:hypothetical protein
VIGSGTAFAHLDAIIEAKARYLETKDRVWLNFSGQLRSRILE